MEAAKMKRILLLGFFLALCTNISAMGDVKPPARPIYKESSPQSLCELKEQRDEKYWPLLRSSVKIAVQASSGSGTICHYDESTGWAYVISCGHLWSGNKRYESNKPSKAKVIVWYKESSRMESSVAYEAEALFWSNTRGKDVSLLRFKPDWNASFAPIARDFLPKEGETLNSMGCDGGKEVARYEVVVKQIKGIDLITTRNSPRPGRSGGGLLTDDCRLVGVCWGTSDPSSGDGIGYFTPLVAIVEVFEENEHSWLLNSVFSALEIPVLDHDNPSSKYDRHFVPTPRL